MRRDPNRSADIIEGKKTAAKILTFLCGAFLLFFWALPEIGHQILLSKHYHLKDSPVYTGDPLDCSRIESERMEGRFLGVYPYAAVIMRGCRYETPSLHKKGEYVKIVAKKPHTLFYYINRPNEEMRVSSFKVILIEERL